MGIDNIVDDMSKIHEGFRSFETAKATPHCFDPVFDLPIMSLDRIVVVLQTSELCLDRHTESECGHIEEQFVEGPPVVPESVADKYHELAFLFWLMPLVSVSLKDLVVAGDLHLLKERYTTLLRPFLDEKMGRDVLRYMVDTI